MSSFFESDSLQLGYGNQVVISDLKISLESSKNYEIIGKNGSGKTTLLMCISNNFIGNTFNSDIKINFGYYAINKNDDLNMNCKNSFGKYFTWKPKIKIDQGIKLLKKNLY